MSQNGNVGIHEPVHAVLHARLLAPFKLAAADLARDALSEADVCKGVDRCLGEVGNFPFLSACSSNVFCVCLFISFFLRCFPRKKKRRRVQSGGGGVYERV